jgi:hypothetical protein
MPGVHELFQGVIFVLEFARNAKPSLLHLAKSGVVPADVFSTLMRTGNIVIRLSQRLLKLQSVS